MELGLFWDVELPAFSLDLKRQAPWAFGFLTGPCHLRHGGSQFSRLICLCSEWCRVSPLGEP